MGPRHEAYNFFSRLGFRCPYYFNPADYYIALLAIIATERVQGLERSKVINFSKHSTIGNYWI